MKRQLTNKLENPLSKKRRIARIDQEGWESKTAHCHVKHLTLCDESVSNHQDNSTQIVQGETEQEEDVDVYSYFCESSQEELVEKEEEEEEDEEEEEEQDIDVLTIIPSSTQSSPFEIGTILSNMVSHLPINEIIKLRGVNTLFNNELAFEFECYNFNIFFKYKNKYTIDIINNQCCGTLEKFTLFYLQSINLKKLGFALKRNDDVTSRDDDRADHDIHIASGRKLLNEKSCKSQYLFTIETNTFHLTDESIFSKNMDIEFNETNGNCVFKPFKSLYFEEKLIQERLSSYDLYFNDCIDMLTLSRIYDYFPLKNRLIDLISNDGEFMNFICTKERTKYSDGFLKYLWSQLGTSQQLFNHLYTTKKPLKGRPALLSDSSIFGNFDIYEAFIQSLNGNTARLMEGNCVLDGIFGLFAMFMRHDLAKDYIHHATIFGQGSETLVYTIQPQLFIQYKQALVDNCMFVLDDEKEWQFDMINNPRYHPLKRIEFLKLLTKSTQFAKGLFYHLMPNKATTYTLLINTIDHLYHSFNNFKSDWMLDSYSDLNGNINKQKEIHESFRYIIQYLLGIGEYYIDNTNINHGQVDNISSTSAKSTIETIIESNVNGICNCDDGLGVGTPIENGFKFIDLNDDIIKNERDLNLFCQTIESANQIENDILFTLQHPYIVSSAKKMISHSNDSPQLKPKPDLHLVQLQLDPVTDIRTFVGKMWDFG